METPRNMIWERLEDGSVRVAKYVGEPGTPAHKVLYEHTYSSKDFAAIAKEMAKPYVEPVHDGTASEQSG